MISYKDIKIAVNNQLKKSNINISSKDIKEGFERPSFFVQIDNNIKSSTETQVHKRMSIYVYYFPTDPSEYSIEVLEMQDTIECLFDLKLKVKDRLLNINDITSRVTDGVLSCSFDLEFWDIKNSYIEKIKEAELMEALDTNISTN